MNTRTPDQLRALVPADADLRYISPDLRPLAVPVAELLKDPRNARRHPDKNLTTIRDSFLRFGQRQALVVNRRNLVTEAGNGRLQVAQSLGWQYIAVSFEDDDALTATAFGLVDNQSALTAEWDDEIRAELLHGLQDEGEDLSKLGFDDDDLAKLLREPNSKCDTKTETQYNTKIEAPIYRPTGPKPAIEVLVNDSRQKQLMAEIDASDASQEEKEFLRHAAQRHLRFDYRACAEYYAHASPAMQRLMESSALVIIDFKQAIELGYVQLAKKMRDLGIETYEGGDETDDDEA